ncbi:MAG: 16S rRNA (uracil(1498)-N(3))-methyltransferase [Flavobacteriales bacterium]|nr:16S rRNA (uracil(1498)-N(3))-methyltransferase [Flavobacteriales bacterium]
MHLFYCPSLEVDLIELPEEEAHHATSVLRLKSGDRIGLLDGRGTRVEAELAEMGKRRCAAIVLDRTSFPAERTARIHLAVAPTKQMERFEWFVEKAVEVGVDRITPLLTDRTERNKLRLDRLERVAIAAMKQSQRTWLPAVDALTTLGALIAQPLPPQRLFGWCEGRNEALMNVYAPDQSALVVIGPEGDLTSVEADQLRSAGFVAVSIGAARLRTETAACAATTWMSLAQQR